MSSENRKSSNRKSTDSKHYNFWSSVLDPPPFFGFKKNLTFAGLLTAMGVKALIL
jgi:hypothetical protein